MTDPHKIRLALGHAGSVLALGLGDSRKTLLNLGTGEKRSVGMPEPAALTGVDLLRTVHVTYGHASLRKTLLILKALGTPIGRVTTDNIKEWVKAGCGICESSRMRRRVFTL